MAAFLMACLLTQDPVSPHYEHLRQLEWLIGTWTSTAKLESGEEYSDEMVVTWIYSKNFIRSEYSLKVGGKVTWAATSVIGYDPDKKGIVGFVFASNGTIARSEAVTGGKKDTWVFESRISGDFPVKEDRVTYTKVDDSTFMTEVEVKKDGAFLKTGKYTHRKSK